MLSVVKGVTSPEGMLNPRPVMSISGPGAGQLPVMVNVKGTSIPELLEVIVTVAVCTP